MSIEKDKSTTEVSTLATVGGAAVAVAAGVAVAPVAAIGAEIIGISFGIFKLCKKDK